MTQKKQKKQQKTKNIKNNGNQVFSFSLQYITVDFAILHYKLKKKQYFWYKNNVIM